MAKQTISIGTTAGDGTGDPLRTAFDKANANFTEVYTSLDLKLAITGDGSSLTGLTKAQVGLANVNNTTDAAKPISASTQIALDAKAALVHTHVVADVTGLQGYLDAKLAITGDGSSLTGLTKTQVGLANVDNTSDTNKPVSTAIQTALDLKANLTGGIFSGGINIAASLANTPTYYLTLAQTDTGTGKPALHFKNNGLTSWQIGVWDGTSANGLIDLNSTGLTWNSVAVATANDLLTKANKALAINDQTGTTYSLLLTDAGSYLRFTNAAAITVTVPNNATVAIPVGTRMTAFQAGTGQVTMLADSGVTINYSPTLKLRSQFSYATLVKVASNIWDFYGDLAAS